MHRGKVSLGRRGVVLVFLAAVLGCRESAAPTAVPDPDLGEPAFVHGPDNANVIRRDQAFFAVVEDSQNGLLLFAGLSDDPGDLCRNVLDSEVMPVQFAGLLGGASKILALGRDINIHVYDLNTFTCVGPPIAQGEGNLTFNVNDAQSIGPGATSLSARVEGRLEDMVNGGMLRVTAVRHYLLLSDGPFRILRSSVELHRIM